MQVALRKQGTGISNRWSCSSTRTVFNGRIQHSPSHGIQFGGRRQTVAFRTGIACLRLVIQRSVRRNIGSRTAAATPKTTFLSRGFRSPIVGRLRSQNEFAMPDICPARGLFIRGCDTVHQRTCSSRGPRHLLMSVGLARPLEQRTVSLVITFRFGDLSGSQIAVKPGLRRFRTIGKRHFDIHRVIDQLIILVRTVIITVLDSGYRHLALAVMVARPCPTGVMTPSCDTRATPSSDESHSNVGIDGFSGVTAAVKAIGSSVTKKS